MIYTDNPELAAVMSAPSARSRRASQQGKFCYACQDCGCLSHLRVLVSGMRCTMDDDLMIPTILKQGGKIYGAGVQDEVMALENA